MGKLKNRIGILTILIILMSSVFNLHSVMAASTTTLTASSTTVKSGETFSVTVSSSLKLTGWTIALTNNGGCTFSSASGGEVNGSTIFGTDVSGKTSLATYTFKAPTVNKDTKYTISFSGSEMCDENTDEVKNATCKATITVKAKKTTTDKTTTSDNKNTTTTDKTTTDNKNSTITGTNKNTTTTTKPKEKSSNAYLSTLGVTPKEYDFSDFSKTKYTYNVTVPSDVDSLKVLYKTADANAKVKVTGNSGFETGTKNKITIKVTAEDGKTTKTYTIKVTKLTEEEDKPGNVLEDENGLYLTSLDIEGLELSPKFVKDTYSYTATLSDSTVNEVTVNAIANKEQANVDISGNTDLVEGENTINILVTLPDSAEQTVYQIVVNKETTLLAGTTNSSESNNSFDIMELMNGYLGIAIFILVFLIIIVIVLVILLRRDSKKRKQGYDYYATEEEIEESKTEEYNVFKNDENEFANNDIEKDNFIESLYKQRNGVFEEELTEGEKETLDEIKEQTDKIFEEKEVEGQSVEYSQSDFGEENPLEERRRRRGKGRGKHF